MRSSIGPRRRCGPGRRRTTCLQLGGDVVAADGHAFGAVAFEFDDLGQQAIAFGRLLRHSGSRASADAQTRASGCSAWNGASSRSTCCSSGDHGLFGGQQFEQGRRFAPLDDFLLPTTNVAQLHEHLVLATNQVGQQCGWRGGHILSAICCALLPLTHVVQQHSPFFAAEGGGGGEVGVAGQLLERELGLLDRAVGVLGAVQPLPAIGDLHKRFQHKRFVRIERRDILIRFDRFLIAAQIEQAGAFEHVAVAAHRGVGRVFLNVVDL